MTVSWLFLLLAGVLEIGGVWYMRASEGFSKWKPSLLAFAFWGGSFLCLSLALREIPISVAYAVWTGIGATGSVILGMVFFDESKSLLKLLFVFGAVASIVGLKLVS